MSFDNRSSDSVEPRGMSRQAALRLEYVIIGLGILALLMIFQPFSLTLFTIGSMIVVLAGLINNLLPMAQPGVRVRSVVTVAMVVAMIFGIVLLIAIVAAHLYGVYFLKPPIEGTQAAKIMANATKWYAHTFTLSVAAVTAVLAVLVWLQSKRK
jgi:hypothetical protein